MVNEFKCDYITLLEYNYNKLENKCKNNLQLSNDEIELIQTLYSIISNINEHKKYSDRILPNEILAISNATDDSITAELKNFILKLCANYINIDKIFILRIVSEAISCSLIDEKINFRNTLASLLEDLKRYEDDFILANDGDTSENVPLQEAKASIKKTHDSINMFYNKVNIFETIEDGFFVRNTFDYGDIVDNIMKFFDTFKDANNARLKHLLDSICLQNIWKPEIRVAIEKIVNNTGAISINIKDGSINDGSSYSICSMNYKVLDNLLHLLIIDTPYYIVPNLNRKLTHKDYVANLYMYNDIIKLYDTNTWYNPYNIKYGLKFSNREKMSSIIDYLTEVSFMLKNALSVIDGSSLINDTNKMPGLQSYISTYGVVPARDDCNMIMTLINNLISKLSYFMDSVIKIPTYNYCGNISIYSTVKLRMTTNDNPNGTILVFKIYPNGISIVDKNVIAANSRLGKVLLGRTLSGDEKNPTTVRLTDTSASNNTVTYEILSIY